MRGYWGRRPHCDPADGNAGGSFGFRRWASAGRRAKNTLRGTQHTPRQPIDLPLAACRRRRRSVTEPRTAAPIKAAPDRPPLIVLLAGPAICLPAGSTFLWQHLADPQPVSHRAAAGLLLVAFGGCQLWIGRREAKANRSKTHRAGPHFLQRRGNWPGSRRYLRWLFTCAVACYGLALAFGTEPAFAPLFAAAIAACHTLLLAIMLRPAGPRHAVRPPDRRWRTRDAVVRGAGRLAFMLAMGATAAELAVRAIDWQFGGRLAARHAAETCKLPPGADFNGRPVNSLGYWDDEFVPQRRPDAVRIAVLGRLQTIVDIAGTNAFAELEQSPGDVEVYNFGLRDAGPREFAAQFASETPAFHPDLTIVVLSVDDLTASRPPPHAFDWRSLRLYQWSCRILSPWLPLDRALPVATDESFERSVQRSLPALALCRSPALPAAEEQWRESLSWLDDLYRESRRRDAPLVLMLCPSDLQTQSPLRQAACRQAGCDPTQVDVESPQRRFKTFADARNVPIIDLLPHLRAAAHTPRGAKAGRTTSVACETLAHWLAGQYADRTIAAGR